MRKDTDQNNSEYGHFLRNVTYLSSHFILENSFEKFEKASQRIYLTQTCIDKNKCDFRVKFPLEMTNVFGNHVTAASE